MIIFKATREHWRMIESLAIRCPEVSAFTRDTLRAHGAPCGAYRDSERSSAGIDAADARAMLSAARHASAEMAKRPRYLENPRFVVLREVACILSAALDGAGFVSDCY